MQKAGDSNRGGDRQTNKQTDRQRKRVEDWTKRGSQFLRVGIPDSVSLASSYHTDTDTYMQLETVKRDDQRHPRIEKDSQMETFNEKQTERDREKWRYIYEEIQRERMKQ